MEIENNTLEHLIVVSKVKKFIKEQQDLNVSQSFYQKLDDDIYKALEEAIEHAKKMNRKTLMGRDFSFYKENPQFEEVLVVSSKIKRFVKEKAELSTSSQVMEQLTIRVRRICLDAIESAVNDKRKTVLDRDFKIPTSHVLSARTIAENENFSS